MHHEPSARAGRHLRRSLVLSVLLYGLSFQPGFSGLAAMPRDHGAGLRITVRSYEEPSIDGAFVVDFAVTSLAGGSFGLVPVVKLEPGEECLQTARLTSGGDPPDELGPGERFLGRFEITYAAALRPFSYCRLWLGLRAPDVPRPVVFEPVYVYFTPYETVEVWSAEDFDGLQRIWNSPSDRTGRRRALARETIPASDLTESELASPGMRVRLASLPGLGYSVPRRVSSVFAVGGPLRWFLRWLVPGGQRIPILRADRNAQAGAVLQAGAMLDAGAMLPAARKAAVLPAGNGAGGGGGASSNRFAGTVSGGLFTIVENDLSNLDPTSLDIVGIKVELLRKRSLTDEVIGTAFTGEGGTVEIDFDTTVNDPDIDVYLKVTAENKAGTIRVRKRLGGARSETYFKDAPHHFLPGTGLAWDFGALSVDADDVKPQLLHWANRARSFVEQELGSVVLPTVSNDPLDIMRSFAGSGQSYFIPGGYSTAAAILAPLVFGTLGVPAGIALALVVSNNDGVYVGSDRQLDEDVLYHEFGHYLMWHLQGQAWLDPLKAGFATHSQQANDEHPELAWTEGFASGFGAIVDAVFETDDGEFGIDDGGFFEDRDMSFSGSCVPPEGALWSVFNCGGGSTPNCASGQVLTHGFHSEWSVASMIWDLWDGPSQPGAALMPNLCGTSGGIGDFEDGGLDTVELTFHEIVQPLLDNSGSGFVLQGGNLLSDVLEYFTHLRDHLPASLSGLTTAAAKRAIKDVLVLNGIRNLALDVTGAGIVKRSLEADLPNTDELSFERDVTVDFYKLKSNGTWKWKGAKTNTFRVDVTALLDGDDDYSFGNTGLGASTVLSDDLLVTGQPGSGNAKLSFNAPGIAGWQSSSNSYGMPQDFLAVVGPTFEARFAGGMTLEVSDGGRMILGDPLGNFTAEVRVEAGARLILRDGTLKVNDASRLIIERGATLEIDVGAEIQLNSSSTALEIHGDLLIRENAEFTYGGGGSVLFDLPDAGGLPNVTMEPGSSINIEESLFIVQSNTYVKPTEDPTTEVRLWYATGEFGEKSYFDVSHSTLRIEGSTITATGAAHAGVVVNGYPSKILNSVFFGGDPCIHAFQQGSSPLTVIGSEFGAGAYGILSEGVPVGVMDSTFSGFGTAVQVSDSTAGLVGVTISACGIGLSTIRGGGSLLDSVISACQTGWYAEDLQGTSTIEGGIVYNGVLYCIVNNAKYGVQLDAGTSTEATFSLAGTAVDDNGTGVWASGAIKVEAHCSRVTNHLVSGFHLAAGALLDIDNSSGVQVTGNMVSIELDLAAMPLLDLGDNILTPAAGGMTLSGTIDAPCAFGSVIPANRNTGAPGVPLGATPTNVTDSTGTCTFGVQGATLAQAVACP